MLDSYGEAHDSTIMISAQRTCRLAEACNHLLVLQERMELAKGQVSAAETGVKAHDEQLASCQRRLNKLQAEAQAAEQAADLV